MVGRVTSAEVTSEGVMGAAKCTCSLLEEMGDVMAMIRIIQQTYDKDGGILENRVQKRLTKMRNPDYT